MCFSAEASFIASALLAIISVASYRKISNQGAPASNRLPLVGVSAGFALQQFSEGFVWLSLRHGFSSLITTISTYTFIFFAFIFWPSYVPYCAYKIEPNPVRRGNLKMISALGILVSIILLAKVLYYGVDAEIANCHILYISGLGYISPIIASGIMACYLISTAGALLLSSIVGVRVVGFLVSAAYIATYLFYYEYLVSVWCFFSAVASLLVYWVISER